MPPRLRPPAALALIGLAAWAGAAPPGPNRDWPEYQGGPDRNHYSPLDRINTANVGRLAVAWEYHSADFGANECNPIVIDGVLYGATFSSRLIALNAATGRPLWVFTDPDNVGASNWDRGVTYWSRGPDRRILGTIGPWLYALDAGTGKPIPGFGVNGKVSLKAGLGPLAQTKWVVSTTPGTLFEDLLVMPTRVAEDASAAHGTIQAFNVRTGAVAWTFNTIPLPGEPGYATWPKDAYNNPRVGSANCWAGMAVDRRRGILYVPTGSAAPDFWGGDRLGQDLYANCLLALDVRTGKLLWHYQFVHHDLWDRDLPAPPNLVTIVHRGHRVDAVAQITKAGYVFVFDRVSGQPLFPIQEVPVPPSPLPGERAWPTQPRPEWPAPYTRQAITEADLSPYAENRAALAAWLRQARTGAFQPFGTDETVIVPGFDGGAEWGGAAADPQGILYVNANEIPSIGSLSDVTKSGPAQLSTGRKLYNQYCAACHGPGRQGQPMSGIPSLLGVDKKLARSDVVKLIASGRNMMPGAPYLADRDRGAIASFLWGSEEPATGAEPAAPDPGIRYVFNGYRKFLDSRGYPAVKPPWGSLTAIDLNTGNQVWKITLGDFEKLSARGGGPTGTQNYGGPVVTAGGLIFIAATEDEAIRAFDRRTGRLLWQAKLPASGFATPAVYEVGGREYVVIACGGGKLSTSPFGDAFVAFALP